MKGAQTYRESETHRGSLIKSTEGGRNSYTCRLLLINFSGKRHRVNKKETALLLALFINNTRLLGPRDEIKAPFALVNNAKSPPERKSTKAQSKVAHTGTAVKKI